MAPIHSGTNTGVGPLLRMKYQTWPKKSPNLEYFKTHCKSHAILNLPELERKSENHSAQVFWPTAKEIEAQRGKGIYPRPTAG